jgi:class 3 adenylate cyclase
MTEAHPGKVGRRLAAIVAADVAGYSRLMGLDEVGTARNWDRRPKYACLV